MPPISFIGVLIVAAVAFLVPLVLGLVPRVRVPSVALEIVAGIVIGPSVLGWVRIDPPIEVLALIGLAFTLFLAGLEIEFARLRGRLLVLAVGGFLLSFGFAIVFSYGLKAVGAVETALFVAIILSATSLGVVIPVLKDTGQSASSFGQLVIVAASIADFGTIILLSLLFSKQATGRGTQLVLIGVLALVAVAIAVAVLRIERWMRLSAALVRLQDTTAQIRVRGAFVLLALFVALAERLGLEVILGAFLAGAILKIVDRDRAMTHPLFRLKLEAAGSGFFIPFFFISSGIRFDLGALFASPATLLRVPLFLVALLLVRGLPALLYRPLVGGAHVVPAGLLQATSLGFVVVAAQIGQDLGKIGAATGAALIATALLSVLLFPLGALTFLQRAEPASAAGMTAPAIAYDTRATSAG